MVAAKTTCLNPDKSNYTFISLFSSCFSSYDEISSEHAADSVQDDRVKGNLKRNIKFWRSINANEKVCNIIENGYKIPFVETPNSVVFENNKSAIENSDFVIKSIQDLVKLGTAVEKDDVPLVVSPLSVSIRSSGKKRLILDLRYINSHLYKEYVKFDDWSAMENYLEEDSFAYKFDLKQGYHHVDIFHDHQKYLGFSWLIDGKKKYFVFTVLPFGISTAPYVFTKVMRPLVKYWRSNGIKICVYLDDGLGVEKSHNKAIESSSFVRKSLEMSGFVANSEKSIWDPTTALTWLGISLNLEKNYLFITDERVYAITVGIQTLLKTPYTSARKIAQIVGKIVSTKYVVGDIVRLKTRYLHLLIENRTSWDATLNILNFPKAHREILFWVQNIHSYNQKFIKCPLNPQVIVSSDASSVGMGAVIENGTFCHRNFTLLEKGKSSTWREMMAVLFSLRSFSNILKSSKVIWRIDNYAAAKIIKVGSPVADLHEISLDIFDLCFQNQITLKPVWVPRIQNKEADRVSRIIDIDDWEITSTFFNYLDSLWGPFTIDRFANSQNKKLQRFNSKYSCPGTEAVDALSQKWEGENNLLIPPINLIPAVIQYIRGNKITGVLVVPLWESATFWPLLCKTKGRFYYFVKDFLIFDDLDSLIVPGHCPLNLVGSENFRGALIAMQILS